MEMSMVIWLLAAALSVAFFFKSKRRNGSTTRSATVNNLSVVDVKRQIEQLQRSYPSATNLSRQLYDYSLWTRLYEETQLYCCMHKVPVCGDCICFPEHNACEVRTYAEWMVDSSCSFLPKCTFCLQILTHSSRFVTRLGCLHVLHNSCLLLLLKGSSSRTGYTCPSCKSQ
ncbi:hypothetical protein SUGI_0439090 [Cryptomeria japonica]|nr:hypothetical protein SUGI_0439090 [Cryptomeria japonica]